VEQGEVKKEKEGGAVCSRASPLAHTGREMGAFGPVWLMRSGTSRGPFVGLAAAAAAAAAGAAAPGARAAPRARDARGLELLSSGEQAAVVALVGSGSPGQL
jgi:hypothetical protein